MNYEAYLSALDDPIAAASLPYLTFREYMEVCMFDPEVGYYGSGKVQIGMFKDYWTFPVRMSPVFGELLANRVVDLLRALRSRVEEGGHPFHVVEVGGGRGELLRDVVLALERRSQEEVDLAALLSSVKLVSVDKSGALLSDQLQTQAALAVEHVNASAEELDAVLPQPFFGLVFANELLTQLSVELLRVEVGQGWRLRVLPWCAEPFDDLTQDRPDRETPGVEPAFRPLRSGALPELIAALGRDESLLRRFAAGELVRWTGMLEPLDPLAEDATADYLGSSWRAVERLSRAGGLPTWVAFAPGARAVLTGVARLLRSGAGAFLTVDYGGTAYHVFDSASRLPHVRTFSRLLDGDPDDARKDEYVDKVHNPLRAPGCEDLTYDLDFTWLAYHLERKGLELAFYGHQGALEGELDLWSKPYQDQLVSGRLREGFSGMDALKHAHHLLKRFRSGAGFRAVALTSPGLSQVFAPLGLSDPLRFEELARASRVPDESVLRPLLVEELVAADLPQDQAEGTADECLGALHATGSPVDDLADVGLYAWRGALLAALERAGG